MDNIEKKANDLSEKFTMFELKQFLNYSSSNNPLGDLDKSILKEAILIHRKNISKKLNENSK